MSIESFLNSCNKPLLWIGFQRQNHESCQYSRTNTLPFLCQSTEVVPICHYSSMVAFFFCPNFHFKFVKIFSVSFSQRITKIYEVVPIYIATVNINQWIFASIMFQITVDHEWNAIISNVDAV